VVTLEQLRLICPHSPIHALLPFVDPLNAAMEEFEINTPARQAHFIAQLAHESGGFRYVREISSGAAYDHREDLGNTKPEAVAIANRYGTTAGRWWRGHGPIQITGYDNHVACGDALGLDLREQPFLLEDPVHGCRAAGWFWTSRNLNEPADRNDIKSITRKINGGYNGLADRVAYFQTASATLT